MARFVRYALRFTIVVALLSSISYLIGPAARRANPYASALMDLTAGSSLAAPGCQHKVCFVNRHNGNLTCLGVDKTDNRNCILTSQTTCDTVPC